MESVLVRPENFRDSIFLSTSLRIFREKSFAAGVGINGRAEYSAADETFRKVIPLTVGNLECKKNKLFSFKKKFLQFRTILNPLLLNWSPILMKGIQLLFSKNSGMKNLRFGEVGLAK